MSPDRGDDVIGIVHGTSGVWSAFESGTTQENQFFATTYDGSARQGSRTQQRNKDISMDNIIKCRHLNQDERNQYHLPAPDWQECSRGEELRHSTTLEISDILTKFKIKPV